MWQVFRSDFFLPPACSTKKTVIESDVPFQYSSCNSFATGATRVDKWRASRFQQMLRSGENHFRASCFCWWLRFGVCLLPLAPLCSLTFSPVDFRLAGPFTAAVVMSPVRGLSRFWDDMRVSLLRCWYSCFCARLFCRCTALFRFHLFVFFTVAGIGLRFKVARLLVLTRSSGFLSWFFLSISFEERLCTMCWTMFDVFCFFSVRFRRYSRHVSSFPFMFCGCCCFLASSTPWYTPFRTLPLFCFCSWSCLACFVVVPFWYSSLSSSSSCEIPSVLLSLVPLYYCFICSSTLPLLFVLFCFVFRP